MSASLRNVQVKRRGATILGPIDIDLGDAGFTIVLGPNGAGKTTLLKALHGVERLSSGRVVWSAPDQDARETQAYVFQKPIMLRRTVRQNLAFPLQILKVDKTKIADRVTDWARRIGLYDALDRPAIRISGGEQQKLALARALIRDPQVLFLDEPCANLDGRSTREIEDLLVASRASGTRIIMTTHDLGQARRLATDVVFLLKGKLVEQTDADSFFERPETNAAQAYLRGDIIE